MTTHTNTDTQPALLLTVVDGAGRGRSHCFAAARAVLGALPVSDFVLEGLDGGGCELVRDGHGVRVRALDERTELRVDGVRVIEAYVQPGSQLSLGAITLACTESGAGTAEVRSFGELVGASEAMHGVFDVLARSAASDATVLIEGETGTGKEGAAHAIHMGSARREGPFVVVDCGAIPENLIESELFGHEKGAFTGAVQRHLGAFEQADGGTVFLDEVGELPLDLQPKLLRVLEQKTVRRVGSGERRSIDVRIVAATNRDLKAEVSAGRFRSDLYFRLSVLRVALPPLRARTSDLGLVTRVLLERIGASAAQITRFTSPSALARLAQHSWPGNVRELRNHLERCVVMDQVLSVEDDRAGSLPQELSASPANDAAPFVIDAAMPYDAARQAAIAGFERSYLKALLERHGGNVSQAAREAGIDRVYLHRLIRRHGVKG